MYLRWIRLSLESVLLFTHGDAKLLQRTLVIPILYEATLNRPHWWKSGATQTKPTIRWAKFGESL